MSIIHSYSLIPFYFPSLWFSRFLGKEAQIINIPFINFNQSGAGATQRI